MRCPSCPAVMQRLALQARLGQTIEIDVCTPCHAFWFEPYETLQLTPASTLQLFRLISEAGQGGAAMPRSVSCPICATALKHSYDWQRGTRFEYWRCERDHGRYTRFNDFLKEKKFVQAMSAADVAKLREKVQTINCSNCGAAVDLVKESSCRHCASPLVMLDREAMLKVASEYQGRPAPPVPPARYSEASSFSILDVDLVDVASWVIDLVRVR